MDQIMTILIEFDVSGYYFRHFFIRSMTFPKNGKI